MLGLLIEKVTGKSWEQNMKDVIFKRAGMTHSGFDFDHLKSPFKSIGYDLLSNTKHIRSIIADSSATCAAGSLYTTAGDLFLWYKALQDNLIISHSTFMKAVSAYKRPYLPLVHQFRFNTVIIGDEVQISVSDKAFGISPENLNNIFDQYYRITSADSKVEGMGLGLFICKEIMDQHLGSIWGESEIEIGSRFHISFPIESSKV